MKPLHRKHVSKHHSAKKFDHNTRHTKGININSKMPMRGGWRL